MIQRTVPRDLKSYKTKQIFGLTTRQLLLSIPAIGLAVGAYFLLRDYVGELSILISLILALPILLFGFWKPYGIPLEKFINSVFTSLVLSPAVRKYKSEMYTVFATKTPTLKNKKNRKGEKLNGR